MFETEWYIKTINSIHIVSISYVNIVKIIQAAEVDNILTNENTPPCHALLCFYTAVEMPHPWMFCKTHTSSNVFKITYIAKRLIDVLVKTTSYLLS